MILQQSHMQQHSGRPVSNGITQPFTHVADLNISASLQCTMMHQQRKPLIQCTDFIQQVTLYLPEVAAFIDESDIGIVHLEVGAMKLATRDALARSDFTTVRKHLFLIADLFDRADATLYDAIRISYLEALFVGEISAAHIVARGMLPRQMMNILRQSELRLERQRTSQKEILATNSPLLANKDQSGRRACLNEVVPPNLDALN